MSFLPAHLTICLLGHSGPIHSATYSNDGNYLLSASQDRTIKLWNPSTGLCIKTYSGHGKDVLFLALPPNSIENTKFASCSSDRNVFIWDVPSGLTIKRFSGHSHKVNSVAFNSDASVVASASYDSTVKLWDTRSQSRAPIQSLNDAKDSVESVSIKNHEILTGSVDGFVRQYDVRMGLLTADNINCILLSFANYPVPVTCARYSGDQNCITSTSLDSIIRLIDKENGEILNQYSGHINNDYRIISCMTPTDSHIISGSEDGKIYMWDLTSAVRIIDAHDKTVSCVQYNPKRNEVISASLDGSLKVWVDDDLFSKFMQAQGK